MGIGAEDLSVFCDGFKADWAFAYFFFFEGGAGGGVGGIIGGAAWGGDRGEGGLERRSSGLEYFHFAFFFTPGLHPRSDPSHHGPNGIQRRAACDAASVAAAASGRGRAKEIYLDGIGIRCPLL
mmetsp:Transcript_8837/g.16042  ORF Transcript_8837/g.16042 Transcript_8837/m.16042 type:complete len:124 (-) Transcript_8837:283-654(-)